ncbi:oligopeptide ABC transporter, periplasmic oligopeptide-binding protein OppA [Mycoplasma sp. NEAQ87857]|uniref:ABC transporter substrate-binding protein n=1 Tax=Mycoplasma sp. NEAQ87857 TaxID=2683967 RepID=UPI00131961F9|nr:ABC transporter substrate-binding protein [Mycoplasma sp. NEAQ87857]QGZ97496.1 oligopeptide ABC transporter, periplasmic oligopeptide-binding protein OppA [Mycoplasma sp. NEAQ87857]
MKKRNWKLSLLALTTTPIMGIAVACASSETKNDDSKNQKNFKSKLDTPTNINNLKKDTATYDLGLVSEPISSLNYITKKSLDKILPSLVLSYFKNGPTDALKRQLNTGRYSFVIMDIQEGKEGKLGPETANFHEYITRTKEDPKEQGFASSSLNKENGTNRMTGSSYPLQDFSIFGGVGRSDVSGNIALGDATLYAFPNPKNQNNYMAVTAYTNDNKNFWSNGDVVTSQDLRDYLEYILDFNTGSEKLDQIKKMNIEGAEKFINAQIKYNKVHGRFYKNPWGRRNYIKNSRGEYVQDPNQKVWQSQSKNDAKEIEEIKNAALSFGFYTGQLFLDYPNSLISNNIQYNPNFDLNLDKQQFKIKDAKGEYEVTLVKNPYVNPYQTFTVVQDEDSSSKTFGQKILKAGSKGLSNSENSFTMIFNENGTPNLSFLLSSTLSRIFPINRKYVETQGGGILKYGNSTSNFLTTGPFKVSPEEIVFGPQGFIILRKNRDYFDVENVIPDSVKIIFSTQRNVNSILFEDGIISQTTIPGSKINDYWTSKEYRKYLKKNVGYGTIALAFNLDQESNGNSAVQDQNIRNAIFYAINREEMLRYVGWDFTLPVTNWTAYGQYKTFDGRNLEMFFEDKTYKTKNNETHRLQNLDFITHLAKQFNFERTIRTDIYYQPKTTMDYVELYKKAHPNVDHVTVSFLVNGDSAEQNKAGEFLKEKIERASNGFIKLDVRTLPGNTYSAFLETGKFDMIYDNFDRVGGNNPQDYIAAFFKRDGINSLEGTLFGFKNNPVGDFIYADYFVQQYLLSTNQTAEQVLAHPIQVIQNIINSNAELKEQFNRLKQSQNTVQISNFSEKTANTILKEVQDQLNDKEKVAIGAEQIKQLLRYLLLNNTNMKKTNIQSVLNSYVFNVFGIDEIYKNSQNASARLNETTKTITPNSQQLDLWKKAIELSFIKNNEDIQEYSDRLNGFFSGNFSQADKDQGWTQDYVYSLIGTFEKIIRDASPVIPLMEVDTNWEISKVGGVSSLFTFDLQYAYDVTKPPRPGLPLNVEGR